MASAHWVKGHETPACPLVSVCFVFFIRHKYFLFSETLLSTFWERTEHDYTHSKTLTHRPSKGGVKSVKRDSESLSPAGMKEGAEWKYVRTCANKGSSN